MNKSKFKEYLAKAQGKKLTPPPVNQKDKARRIIDGFNLLKKYGVEEVGTPDQLWAGPKSSKVSREDTEMLHALGWFIDSKKDRWTIYT